MKNILVEVMDGGHVILAQCEVKDVEVFLNVLLVRTLRYDYQSSLYLPSDGHLSGRLLVLLADTGQSRVLH